MSPTTTTTPSWSVYHSRMVAPVALSWVSIRNASPNALCTSTGPSVMCAPSVIGTARWCATTASAEPPASGRQTTRIAAMGLALSRNVRSDVGPTGPGSGTGASKAYSGQPRFVGTATVNGRAMPSWSVATGRSPGSRSAPCRTQRFADRPAAHECRYPDECCDEVMAGESHMRLSTGGTPN